MKPSTKEKILVPIVVAAIGAGATIYTKIHTEKTSASKLRYTIKALDNQTNTGIEQADVSLEAGAQTLQERTDSLGKHTFELSPEYKGEKARLRVSRANYKPYEEEVLLPTSDDTHSVHVKPTQEQSDGSGTTQGVHTSGIVTATVVKTFSSGPKLSGVGKSFSDWYTLCSDPAPPGYKIDSVEYILSGDRSCGAWAECRLTEKTDARACFQFRLQGHDEMPPPGQALSEGVLKISYREARGGT